MRFFSAAFGRVKAGLLGFFRSKRAATDGKDQQSLEPRRGLDAGGQAGHESERLYRILVENTSDIMTLMDADGAVHYESAAFERVMGYLPDEPVGTNAFDRIHPDDVDRALSIYAEVLGTQVSIRP
jgi:PAS domain-containing protein